MGDWKRRLGKEDGIFLGIFLASCALRLLFLDGRSLWFDEACTLAIAREPLSQIVPLVRVLEGSPPLHYLLIHFWLMLFRDPVLGLRSFSWVCGAAALGLFISQSRRMLAPRAALGAAVLAGLSSFWVHLSQDGRLYSLLLMISLLETRLFLAAKSGMNLKSGAAWAAAALCGLYTHNFFFFLLAAHAVDLAISSRGTPRALRAWIGPCALIAAGYAPWLGSLASQVHAWAFKRVLHEPLTLLHALRILGTMFFDTSFLGLLHPRVTQAAGAAVLFLAAVRARRPFLWIHLLAPLLVLAAAEKILGGALAQTRYLAFLSPFLYWLVATAADDDPARLRGLGRILARAAPVVLMAAGVLGYFASGFIADPRLKALSALIERGTPHGTPVVHIQPFYYMPLRYYYLPGRRHLLASPDCRSQGFWWAALPGEPAFAGYPACVGARALRRLESCVVVDPERRIFNDRIGLASGKSLARILREKM